MIEIMFPGKAYEMAAGNRSVDTDLRLKLKTSEKRKKGRGYRVLVSLTPEEAKSLLAFYNQIPLKSLSLVDAQAVKNITDRLYEGTNQERPAKPEKVKAVINEEEAAAKKKSAIDKRGQAKRARTQEAIWSIIFPMVEARHCQCQLRKGMSLEDLRELGGGCTDPHDLKYKVLKMPKIRSNRIIYHDRAGHICPTLDTYRRAVEKLQPKKDVYEDES